MTADWFQISTFVIFLQLRFNEAPAPMEDRATIRYRGGDLSYLEPGSRSCAGHAESSRSQSIRIGIARGGFQRWPRTLGRQGTVLRLLRGLHGYHERQFRSQESKTTGEKFAEIQQHEQSREMECAAPMASQVGRLRSQSGPISLMTTDLSNRCGKCLTPFHVIDIRKHKRILPGKTTKRCYIIKNFLKIIIDNIFIYFRTSCVLPCF